jgi:DNA-directed RNA polymerase subunit RPC12/RpoP
MRIPNTLRTVKQRCATCQQEVSLEYFAPMSVLSKPYFHDEAKAFEYLESVLWADGIVCPHCGVIGGRVYA